MKRRYQYLLGLACILSVSFVSHAVEWRGYTAIEHRTFLESPLDPDQHDNYSSVVINPEFYHTWDNQRQSLTISPFYRWDQHDDQRTHGDLREFYWLYLGEWHEVYAGFRKVFWGTTESQHLVDVINQTDLVENPDGEDKLGQPMLATVLLTDWGNVELYMLPYFRERTFPGKEGRLRSIPRVETDDDAVYEHRKKEKHVDWALRWSGTLGHWDIGLSYFYGTNREPRLVPAINSAGEPVYLPHYDLMRQIGIDVQGAIGAWLWKLEAIHRDTNLRDFSALTTGFEYTFYNIKETGIDVGLVAEYLYDDRGNQATTPFDDDIFIGLRLTPNDIAGTEFLLGMFMDRASEARIYSLETSRRLTGHVRISVEGVVFSGLPASDPFYSFRHDDYIQAGLSYFF